MLPRVLPAFLALSGLLVAQAPPAKKPDPVQWTLQFEPAATAPGQKALGRLTATIEPGWHLYSLTTPRPPIATTITLQPSPAVDKWTVWTPPSKRAFDPNFKTETETYQGSVEFVFDLTTASAAQAGSADLAAQARYQACNDQVCLFPVRKTITATLKIDAAAQAAALQIPPGYTEFVAAAPSAAGSAASSPAPVAAAGSQGAGQFLLLALSFGFLAIFTPCVFPMIPITMSYFLGAQTAGGAAAVGEGQRQPRIAAQSVIQAFTFCIGVIVLFTGLGVLVTAILGPFGLSQLGSNPWVNLFIALVFVAFGLSLLGAFEITIPSGVLTTVTNASYRGGIAGALIMGLAFALASFACTGPFVGTLLAGSAQGGVYWPILGMFVFSIGLASPFFFLALFPAYLARLPKSGGWLERTKITLGFLILAAAMKYFSNIDQVYQWNILTRARFLAVWIVMLTLAGLYLLGILKLKDQKDEPVSLWRLFAAVLILVVAVSLVPGMFGARLGELDAYVPAATEGSLAPGSSSELKWIKDDYRQALDAARQTGKPVFVNFTGYACTNCHWMEANMFTRPEVASALQNFVLLKLYTDGSGGAVEANQKMAETRFGTSAIPFYAIVQPDDRVVATFAGATRDAKEFEAFLNRGLPAAVPAAPASAAASPSGS
ncbi:MAG TPA: cytochrome c biogenesis protein CcdA [Bryobacterales bacterium]|nr:cytochrome c biogenesis protein CcdA [Bryobacterales bacterium]